MIRQSFSFRSSPYPTPQDLREYEEIHPGFTDRMLTLTERETDHRIREESLQNRATIGSQFLGGVVLYTGAQAYMHPDGISVLPISRLWRAGAPT